MQDTATKSAGVYPHLATPQGRHADYLLMSSLASKRLRSG